MIPDLTTIEDTLKDKLEGGRHSALWAGYNHARNYLMSEVLPHINRVEPNLTDHGPDHVVHVLNNIYDLVGSRLQGMHVLDLYMLCLSGLMHDIGNIEGREDHHKKIGRVFDSSRGTNDKLRREKRIIMQIVGAHSGESADGDADTLKELAVSEVFNGGTVNVQEVGTLVRFADECAEGKQRTSEELLRSAEVTDFSKRFHLYALNTEVGIVSDGRIVIDYDLNVDFVEDDLHVVKFDVDDKGDQVLVFSVPFDEYFNMLCQRIEKLNSERKYAKYYSSYIDRFKKVSVTIRFWNKTDVVSNSVSYELDDKVLPSDTCLEEHFAMNNVDVAAIQEDIRNKINELRSGV